MMNANQKRGLLLMADILDRVKAADKLCPDDAQYRAMVKVILEMGEFEVREIHPEYFRDDSQGE